VKTSEPIIEWASSTTQLNNTNRLVASLYKAFQHFLISMTSFWFSDRYRVTIAIISYYNITSLTKRTHWASAQIKICNLSIFSI
jgi:hypothetical protein